MDTDSRGLPSEMTAAKWPDDANDRGIIKILVKPSEIKSCEAGRKDMTVAQPGARQ